MSDDEMRFSDGELVLLQEKLDTHIEEFHQHVEAEENRWNQLLTATEKNSESIGELAASTKDIIEIYQAANGAIKVGITFGKFVKWVTQIAVIGVAIKWLLDNFGT